jgi:HK97 family phage prohead protease
MNRKFDAGFELKFLAETGTFEGYASVFNVVDNVQDKIAPGAFRDSLAQYHREHRFPPLLWQHDAAEPVGAWREMYEDSHGLYVKGDLFINDIALAKEAYKLLKENVVTGLSIGYRARESHREEKSGVRVLTKLDLLEVSLVTFPANELARVSGVKGLSALLLLKESMQKATTEINNGLAARRLSKSLREAALNKTKGKPT